MSEQPRTPEEEAEEFLRTGRLTRTHWVTPEQARERWPDAPPDRPPDEILPGPGGAPPGMVSITERWLLTPEEKAEIAENFVVVPRPEEIVGTWDPKAVMAAVRKAQSAIDARRATALGGERAEGQA